MDDKQLMNHKLAVASAVDQFTNLNRSGDPNRVLELVLLDQLFAVRPKSESRQAVTVKIATDHLLGFVSRAYAKGDHAMQQRFYEAISGHAWFKTLAVEFNPNKRACGRLDNDMVCRYWQYVINIYW
jgi:hypothetical protein